MPEDFCLDHTHIPIVHYPDGFELHQINYMMKGLCPHADTNVRLDDSTMANAALVPVIEHLHYSKN